MGSIWFTSDLHWGHIKVASLRGFDDPNDHDKVLSDNWRARVKPDDIVWVLGDLAASSPTDALDLMRELPGRKRLIKGNHDKNHGMFRDAWKWDSAYREVFEYTSEFGRIKVHGETVLLSHFPYETDHTDEPRHTQYRLRNQGQFLLHGHTHSSQRDTSSVELHVGVDAWDLAPVPLTEVQDWVGEEIAVRELIQRHA